MELLLFSLFMILCVVFIVFCAWIIIRKVIHRNFDGFNDGGGDGAD